MPDAHPHIRFILPGDINTPTGGYRYAREVITHWEGKGIPVDLVSLPGPYPFPEKQDEEAALAIAKTLPPCDITLVDGLAGGAVPTLLQYLSEQGPVVCLLHHPLFMETGLTDAQSRTLFESEAEGLKFVKAIVTSSPTTSRTVREHFHVSNDHIFSVEPGIARLGTSSAHEEGPIRLLSIGSISKRKGHDLLIAALEGLKTLDFQLDIVGSTQFDETLYYSLLERVQASGLADQITFHGAAEQEELEALYDGAHIFVLASRYEGYGIVYAEAIASGLPVIGTTAGAIPQTVPKDCGILVPPDNVLSLQGALSTLITDGSMRERFRQGSLAARDRLPSWSESADQFLNILRRYM